MGNNNNVGVDLYEHKIMNEVPEFNDSDFEVYFSTKVCEKNCGFC